MLYCIYNITKTLVFLYLSFKSANNLLLCTLNFAKFHSCESTARPLPYTGHHWQRQSIMRQRRPARNYDDWRILVKSFPSFLAHAQVPFNNCANYRRRLCELFLYGAHISRPPPSVLARVRVAWNDAGALLVGRWSELVVRQGRRVWECPQRNRTKAVLGVDVFLALSNYSSW